MSEPVQVYTACQFVFPHCIIVSAEVFLISRKYSLQGTTQGNGLTGADMPVRFSM